MKPILQGVAAAAGLTLMLPMAAIAASYASHDISAPPDFQRLDRNHDGYISKKEAKADRILRKDWKCIDTNRDGRLDRSEFSAFENRMPSSGSIAPAGAGAASQVAAAGSTSGNITGTSPSGTPYATTRVNVSGTSLSGTPYGSTSGSVSSANPGGDAAGPGTAYDTKGELGSFSSMDDNREGYVDRAEFSAFETTQSSGTPGLNYSASGGADMLAFTKLDKNGDGRIDQAEFSSFEQAPATGTNGAHGSGSTGGSTSDRMGATPRQARAA